MIGFVQNRANEVSDFFIVFVECKERLRANVMVVKLFLVIFLQTVFQFNNFGKYSMFSKIQINKSTEKTSQQIEQIREKINNADAVVIGAGAGLSTSAGFTYLGERFYKHFSDFAEKYGITDMYSGGFYPFTDNETFWAWWSRHIYFNRYEKAPKPVYDNLLKLVKDKNIVYLELGVGGNTPGIIKYPFRQLTAQNKKPHISVSTSAKASAPTRSLTNPFVSTPTSAK